MLKSTTEPPCRTKKNVKKMWTIVSPILLLFYTSLEDAKEKSVNDLSKIQSDEVKPRWYKLNYDLM